ncbi:acetolactate synthase small subunit [Halobacterium sp. CBA1126]|uniref:acetolactate synthase small subunit n=1 Tax=Halobacterium sp. CBA1126 TaxID=2668074 RepID=UPI0012FC5252|nr:acetolactate synthase small subunit [Halobacterium sp. CBA1126]MUV60386.1 acetolactate synthase small subunit [Halobacterium sp. CBA1126]
MSERDADQEGLPGPAPEDRPRPKGKRNSQGIRVDPEVEAEHPPRRTVISALVEHQPGVLARVSGLFSRRQFNIESLTVADTQNDDWARITVVVEEPDPGIDQVEKQLEKVVPVIHVRELEDDAVTRELVVVKVDADRPHEVHAITEMYNGKTLDAGPRTITVELTGDEGKINDAIDAYRQFGIREIARTGQTALARGETKTAIVPDHLK